MAYLKKWFKDAIEIMANELRQISKDGGLLLIFLGAGLAYPLLYNVIYLNGILSDTPVAVVDDADCAMSRRYIREVDATRELSIAAKCVNMDEARRLMEDRKVNGIIYLPSDFGEKIERMETATLSIYADMSSFLYYKNVLIGTNFVMLHEIGQIQVERYSAAGMTDQEISQLVKPVGYDDNNPFNRAFDYSLFLISAIMMLIIQQVMFYGMTMLAGTAREENRSFATLPAHLHGHGVGRVVFGRGLAYWLLFFGLGIYIATIVPAICGFPQRGNYWDILLLLMFFVTDCILFCQVWSTFINKRETVFVLLLFISPICLFLTGFSWPTTAFPAFWRAFSWLFPSTFGCQAFINLNTAGGDLQTISPQLTAMTIQCVIYFVLSCIALYVEQQIIQRRSYSDTIGQ